MVKNSDPPAVFKKLETLYEKMDNTWDKIARGYSFCCNGCEDNCCTSLFYHHTHIEKAYLIHGFESMSAELKADISRKALNYCDQTFDHDQNIRSLKILCPLNARGRCVLYSYRPMICRLHGLPHELERPGYGIVRGRGCQEGRFDDKAYIKFDRTPFYREMIQIEADFKNQMHKTDRIKETIAQMLVSINKT